MNYRNFSSRSIFLFTLLALFSLSSCSTIGDKIFGRKPVPKNTDGTTSLKAPPYSKFEWAVQSYESGQYETAIASFLTLEQEGTEVPNFEYVPYYLGMSYFQLERYPQAADKLKSFLKSYPKHSKSLEARVSLLLSYEALKDWNGIVTLAAEIEGNLPYAENKALLHLIWAEALSELKEFNGANRQMDEAKLLINSVPYANQDAELNASGEDLQNRLQWTNMFLQLNSCDNTAMPSSQNPEPKKGKKAHHAPLQPIDQWMLAKGDCLLFQTQKAMENFDSLNPKWSKHTAFMLQDFYQRYYDTPLSFDDRRLAKESIKKSFYRIADAIQQKEKHFEYQNVTKKYLNDLLNKLETLILSLSVTSS